MWSQGALSVNINGEVGRNFGSYRLVRSGGSLSSFLLNLNTDCLANMVHRDQQNGQITGLAIHFVENGISVMQYVDKTILFVKYDVKGARDLKLLLQYRFEMMSGLKINFQKSDVLMALEDADKLDQYATLFSCQMGYLPLNYLGVFVSCSRLKVSD